MADVFSAGLERIDTPKKYSEHEGSHKLEIVRDGNLKCALHADVLENGKIVLFDSKGRKTVFRYK